MLTVLWEKVQIRSMATFKKTDKHAFKFMGTWDNVRQNYNRAPLFDICIVYQRNKFFQTVHFLRRRPPFWGEPEEQSNSTTTHAMWIPLLRIYYMK